jgi:uncharacterized membrane protein YbhN (UPF0104 family)
MRAASGCSALSRTPPRATVDARRARPFNSSVTAEAALPSPTRRYAILGLKLAITVGAVTFLLVRQPVRELGRALGAISPAAHLATLGLILVALAVGTLRWRVLLSAYGAVAVPSFGQLLKVYFVGHFYNIYVPGAVGGDVLRGVVTRRAFGQGGAAAHGGVGSVAVVFIERGLGAAGVLALSAIATAVFAVKRFAALLPVCVLGVIAVLAIVFALAHGHRLARFAPGPLGRLLAALPPLARVGPFVLACLLSLGTQSLVALCGHALVHGLEPALPLAYTFVAMPLAAAAGYFPLTIAGIGPRDVAMVELYEQLGVSEAHATAVAFAFLFAQLASGLIGGIVQLVRPIGIDDSDDR